MNDRPNAVELIDAVRGFLETELLPAVVDPRLRYQALVAANVLGIALRELNSEEVLLREEWDALAQLVPPATERPERLSKLRDEVGTLNERLCEAIRSGRFDDQATMPLVEFIRTLIVRKLEVANPRYLQSVNPPTG
ncbi:MAG: DUF6285 domain-containing protein [Gemmataceae bacterium]